MDSMRQRLPWLVAMTLAGASTAHAAAPDAAAADTAAPTATTEPRVTEDPAVTAEGTTTAPTSETSNPAPEAAATTEPPASSPSSASTPEPVAAKPSSPAPATAVPETNAEPERRYLARRRADLFRKMHQQAFERAHFDFNIAAEDLALGLHHGDALLQREEWTLPLIDRNAESDGPDHIVTLKRLVA